ncbi:MAG: ABC transporter ATP-binding protein [Provencibacterium sp.]|jgi:putative ABC transport system ATP-binding protein|nr:ABC transporter ATP-binding protein [Provencibacterium sp.]
MAETLISLRGVCKAYPGGETGVKALENVNLEIEKGEFVSIVGASGSGKSTLMNIIGCLDTATDGEYLFESQSVGALDDEALSRIRNRQIGFIFQGFNLVDSLSALENVELPLLYRRVPKARRRALALSALERVGLSHRLHHRPGQLSGGQQQRVAIARAVAASPAVMLADEPTGNLDSQAGAEVMRILRGLHEEGRTLLLITHDPELAKRSPRRVQVCDGRIVADSGRPVG